MHKVLQVPRVACLQTLSIRSADTLRIGHADTGIERPSEAIIVQIFLDAGHDLQIKARLYGELASSLHNGVGLRAQDLLINLVEVKPEDWSFGNSETRPIDPSELKDRAR